MVVVGVVVKLLAVECARKPVARKVVLERGAGGGVRLAALVVWDAEDEESEEEQGEERKEKREGQVTKLGLCRTKRWRWYRCRAMISRPP